MRVELIASVDEFIEVTKEFRAAEPLRTNVIGSVSLSVAKGQRRYDDYRWWVVRADDAGVGIAMRTSPFNMILAPMPIDAARALGRSVGRLDDSLPGVTGSPEVIEALVEGYVESNSPGSTRALVEDRRDLLYELEEPRRTGRRTVSDERRKPTRSPSWPRWRARSRGRRPSQIRRRGPGEREEVHSGGEVLLLGSGRGHRGARRSRADCHD